jgi:DNA-directed RNA polymerase specialized sigma24 family protein
LGVHPAIVAAFRSSGQVDPWGEYMSMSSRIAPHIPYLRRYARALSGSQASGDAYVAAVLEALIAEPSLFDTQESPRISLYKLFSSLWQSLDVNIREDAPVSAWEETASRNLRAISPLPRQAFLLVAVEGFTTDEAASILRVDGEEFSRLIDQASSDIGRQVSTNIMIIEDEPLIAMDIEQMVESLGHGVTGIARTHKEALALFEEQKPGMVLADIQLADGSSGIDAVNDILAKVAVPVIFITAFPERLLTGERPEPTFLVTKPFNPDMVKALISQALFFESEKRAAA